MLRMNESRFSGFKLQETSFGGVMPPEEQERVRRTFARIALIILCLFGVLFLRLWFLQLLQGDEMQQRSEHNRIRLQDLPPWRGMILDHQGQVLVANRPSFELVVVLEDVGNIPLLAGRLAHLLRLDPQQLTAQLQNGKKAGLHQVRVRADLAWEEMARVETFQPELPGVLIQVQPKREYRHKGMACHVLGYRGNQRHPAQERQASDYKMGDYLGKCGVELAWEKFLRGQRGSRRIEVAATGGQVSGPRRRSCGSRTTGSCCSSGYAIIDNAAFPIVGDPKKAYDMYLEQLVDDAKAAIETAVGTGVVDPDRIGVTGHSHGALMTANLIAQTELFRAGVATSGSYNKTLTPFGFQNERRSVWKGPKRLPQGLAVLLRRQDQAAAPDHARRRRTRTRARRRSRRSKLYEAVRGNGGTARLVMLPHEPHGYSAMESNEQRAYEELRVVRQVREERAACEEAVGRSEDGGRRPGGSQRPGLDLK